MWKRIVGTILFSTALIAGVQSSAQADERSDILREINNMRSSNLKADATTQKVAQDRANLLAKKKTGLSLPSNTNSFPQKPSGWVSGMQLQTSSKTGADAIDVVINNYVKPKTKGGRAAKSTLVSSTYPHGGVGVSSDSNGVTYVVINLAKVKAPVTYTTTTPKPNTTNPQKPQNQPSTPSSTNPGSTSSAESKALKAELERAKKAAEKLKQEKAQAEKDQKAREAKEKKAQADRDKAAKAQAEKDQKARDAQAAKDKADREAQEKLAQEQRDADKLEAERVTNEAKLEAQEAADRADSESSNAQKVKHGTKVATTGVGIGAGGLGIASLGSVLFYRKKPIKELPVLDLSGL